MLESKSSALPLGYTPRMVEEGGFEPPNPLGTDLQSAAFGHFAILPHGGCYRTRTYDPRCVKAILSQLS